MATAQENNFEAMRQGLKVRTLHVEGGRRGRDAREAKQAELAPAGDT